MKRRLMAVFLILLVPAWVPIIAQQSPAPQTTAQPAQPAAKPDHSSASCCQRKDGSVQSMPYCEGKDAKDMPCGEKNAQGKQATANCCDAEDGMSCCHKDAKQSAANATSPDTTTCCASKDHSGCHSKSNA